MASLLAAAKQLLSELQAWCSASWAICSRQPAIQCWCHQRGSAAASFKPQALLLAIPCLSMHVLAGWSVSVGLQVQKALAHQPMGPALLCREIQSHISEPFWHMHCTLRTPDSKSCEFQWERGRLFDHTAAVILYEMCMEDPTATVLKVSHTCSGAD